MANATSAAIGVSWVLMRMYLLRATVVPFFIKHESSKLPLRRRPVTQRALRLASFTHFALPSPERRQADGSLLMPVLPALPRRAALPDSRIRHEPEAAVLVWRGPDVAPPVVEGKRFTTVLVYLLIVQYGRNLHKCCLFATLSGGMGLFCVLLWTLLHVA
jgi:hypothetical protein